MKLFQNILTVGFWTLISRILGMVRDILLLAFIGVGPVLDAFIVAFRLPNMFRRFFAEGALSSAFVPLYSKRLKRGKNAERFALEAISGLTFVLLIGTGLGMVFMPGLVWATASGFIGDERFEIAVEYGQIMFPYILLISLAALLSGALNAHGRFGIAAAAPTFLNIIIINALLLAWVLSLQPVIFLVWSVPIAGAVQLSLLWLGAKKSGITVKFVRPRLSPGMRHLIKVAFPAALANGVVQINLLVGPIVASYFPGAISWLYGADRLYQLPLGVVGIAVGIVLLPELSKRLQAGDRAGAQIAFSRANEISFGLSFPSSIALFVIPMPLVSAIFEHGATNNRDIEAISLACAIYGLGLPAFMLQKILQPLYFSQENTILPFRFALIAMIINGVFAIGLMEPFGWMAPAIAVTISAWAMVGLLAFGASKFEDIARIGKASQYRMIRIGFSAIGMGLVLWGVDTFMGTYTETTLARVSYAIILLLIGFFVYILLANLSGAFKLSDLLKVLKRS